MTKPIKTRKKLLLFLAILYLFLGLFFTLYSFLDRNRMSDACRSAGSFKF